MSRAGDFISASTEDVDITIGSTAVPFTLRVPSAKLLLKVLGSKYLGMIRAARTTDDVERLRDSINQAESERMARKYCEVFMVLPRFGDVTDAENDTICYEDLDAAGAVEQIIGWVMGGGKDFRKSSEEQTEFASPRISMLSEPCTGADPAD